MQTVPQQFDRIAKGPVRPVSYGLSISFDKQRDESVTIFTLDTSELDGNDILESGDNNPLQEHDKYRYLPFTDRVTNTLEVTREVDFPYSVSAAMADFTLNNYDGYFTPGSGSSIAPYVLPSRPLRMFMGFNGTNLQQFVGLTENMPTIDDSSKTISFHAMDFLSRLFAMKIPHILSMRDVRTDEVLDELFQSAGLLPNQYSLARGRNKIKYVHYDKDVTMGYIIRKLMEAEMGLLWMDEQGIIRFVPRITMARDPVYSYDDSNIIDIRTVNSGRIINVVEINAKIREVQNHQPIFTAFNTLDDGYVVPANGTKDIFVSLLDPTEGVTEPTLGVNATDSYYTAFDLSGEAVTGVTVSSDATFGDAYRVTFDNSNDFPVRINDLVVWGDPAKIVDEIKYVDKDAASVEKFGELEPFVIDNDFIQSVAACESIAVSLFDSYSDYSGDIEMEVKGTPAQQVGDYIEVNKATYTGGYLVTKIINRIIKGKFEQIIGARQYINRPYFVLDQSLLNGTGQLTP